MIELPIRDPCDLCLAAREEGWKVIEEGEQALVAAYRPLGILTFQNNGVYSGQETPHFHFHVVPRQEGSDWGIGPPQLATFDGAGRRPGTPHDPGGDAPRLQRVRASPEQLVATVELIRAHLPD